MEPDNTPDPTVRTVPPQRQLGPGPAIGGAEEDVLRARASLEADDPLRAIQLAEGVLSGAPAPWIRTVAVLIIRYARWQSGAATSDLRPLESTTPPIQAQHLCLSAHMEMEALRPMAARSLAVEAYHLARSDPLRTTAATIIGGLLHDEGGLSAAWCDRHLDLPAIGRTGPIEAALAAYRLQARALATEGQVDLGLIGLTELSGAAVRRGSGALLAGALGEMLRLQLMHGQQDAAADTFRQLGQLKPPDVPCRVHAPLRSEQVRAEVRCSLARREAVPRSLLAELAAQECQLIRTGKRRAALGVAIQLSLVEHRRGLHAGSRARLTKVLQVVGRTGAYACLTDEQPWINELLAELGLRRRGTADDDGDLERCLLWLERRHRPATVPTLTRREQEIVSLIARGSSNKQIGRALDIAPETVKTHLRSIFEKLRVRTRAEIAFGLARIGVGTGGEGDIPCGARHDRQAVLTFTPPLPIA